MTADLVALAARPWPLIWTMIIGAALLAGVGFALIRRG
jgi:Na+/H+ antiporter NhaA